ncbi:uncharacterized protein CDAR_311031 [Caerostris darwini]|uniref:Gustatory receptor n=1 Tax=Caerostris darwini TaxID=1538125 RepID=A0AAV4WSS6_9ARAC|nr:uncharacterized protein CDAR_311031 [Caerostris darwini]
MKLCYKSKDLKLSSSYGMILKVLSCTGINIFEDREKKLRTLACRILGFCFAILLHFSAVDYWIMSCLNLQNNWHEYQVVLSLVFSNSIALLIWHALYQKKKRLRILLLKMDTVCNNHLVFSPYEKFFINFVILLAVFGVPIAYSVISVYLMNQADPTHYYTFFTYGHQVDNFTISLNAYLFTKTLMSSLLDPIFTSCVTFIYCLLCHRSCRLLREYRKKMMVLLVQESRSYRGGLKQLVVDYGRLCRVLERLQSVFSLPSFLLILVDVMSSFTILASALLYSTDELTGPVISENAYVLMTSAFLLITLIASAAQVTVTMTTIKMALQKIQEKRAISEDQGMQENFRFRLLQILKERPLVVLSGYQIKYPKHQISSRESKIFLVSVKRVTLGKRAAPKRRKMPGGFLEPFLRIVWGHRGSWVKRPEASTHAKRIEWRQLSLFFSPSLLFMLGLNKKGFSWIAVKRCVRMSRTLYPAPEFVIIMDTHRML